MMRSNNTNNNNNNNSDFSIQEIIKEAQIKAAQNKMAEKIYKQDVILVVGSTGAGKSTLLHYVGGSDVKKDKNTGKLCVTPKNSVLEKIATSSKESSETKSLEFIDLNHKEINTKNKFKLDSSLLICDTPGWSDTDGVKARILNALAIALPLGFAQSVRVLVLISFNDLASKRGGNEMIEILQSVAALIPNTRQHTGGIMYAFTKGSGLTQNQNIYNLIELINNLLANTDNKFNYSDDIKALLLDMQEKFKDGKDVPIINPVKESYFEKQLTPVEIVKKIRELEPISPITNNQLVFTPYVEEACIPTLNLELSDLMNLFDEKIKFFDDLFAKKDRLNDQLIKQKCLIKENKLETDKVNLVFFEISAILEQFKFVDTYFRAYIGENNLEKCKKNIKTFAESLIKPTSAIFENAQNGNKIEELDKDLFDFIIAMQLQFKRIWMETIVGDDMFGQPFEIPGFLLKKTLLDIAIDPFRKMNSIKQSLAELNDAKYQYLLNQELLSFNMHIAEHNGAVENVIQLTDEHSLVEERIKNTVKITDGAHNKLKPNPEAVLKKLESKRIELEHKVGVFDNSISLQNILCNMTYIQAFAETKIAIDHAEWLQAQVDLLEKNFIDSLQAHDFNTTAFVLSQIIELDESLDVIDSTIYEKIIFSKIHSLKALFHESLQILVPLRMRDNTIVIKNYDEDEIYQLIYVSHILNSALQNNIVMKYFEELVSDIYNNIGARLEGSITAISDEIDTLLKDGENIDAINLLQPLLQQCQYIISIPHTIIENSIAISYGKILAEIKLFVMTLKATFAEQLNPKQRDHDLALETYEDIAFYLKSMRDAPWVNQLRIESETIEKLSQAIKKRIEAISHQLNKVNCGNFEKPVSILDDRYYRSLAIQIDMICNILNEHIENSVLSASKKELDTYITMYKSIYNQIEMLSAHCDGMVLTDFAKLTVEEISNFIDFTRRCKELDLFSESIDNTIANLDESIKLSIESKIKRVESIFTQSLSIWQSGEPYSSEEAVLSLMAEMIDIFNFLDKLKDELPEYHILCQNPKEQYQAILDKNYDDFSRKLSNALHERMETEDDTVTDKKFISMLKFCNQIVCLDEYFSKSNKNKNKVYSALHQFYSKALDKSFQKLYNQIVALIRKGDFDQALSIIDENQLLDSPEFLCKQISNVFNEIISSVASFGSNMGAHSFVIEKGLPEFMGKLNILAKASELHTAGLLDEAILKRCENQLPLSQNYINKWYANCLKKLDDYIDKFNLEKFIASMKLLKSTLQSMDTPPLNQYELENDVLNKLHDNVSSIINTFKKPYDQWDSRYKLDIIQAELEYYDDEYKKGMWKTLSSSVNSGIDKKIGEVWLSIDNNNITADIVVKVISDIEALVISIKDEPSQLKTQTLSRCKSCIDYLLSKLSGSNASFENYLENLCLFLNSKDKLIYSLTGFDSNTITSKLTEKISQLSESISNQLERGEFPVAEFVEFIHIYKSISSHPKYIGKYIDRCSAALKKFSFNLFRDLKENLTPNTLEQILTATNRLIQVKQYRVNLHRDNKKFFDGLLPETYFIEIEAFLANSNKELTAINSSVIEALSKKNGNELAKQIKLAYDWEKFTTVLNKCIDVCDNPSIDYKEQLKEAIRKSQPEFLINLIEEELSTELKRSKLNISTFMNDTHAKSAKSRSDYFRRLIDTYEFFISCDKISTIDVVPLKIQLHESTRDYLTQLNDRANKELPEKVEDKESWEVFDNCYQELKLFSDHCAGYQDHLGGIFLGNIKAIDAASVIDDKFNSMLKSEIDSKKQLIDKSKPNFGPDTRQNIVKCLVTMQKLVKTFPAKSDLANALLTDLLNYIRESYDANHFSSLMMDLKDEKSGIGSIIIDSQSCFKGVSTALRNTRTQAYDIKYVLDKMQKKNNDSEIKHLDGKEIAILNERYGEFHKFYEAIITQYLQPDVRFYENSETCYQDILSRMEKFLKQKPVEKDKSGKIIWSTAEPKIKTIMSYLFALWTLHDAKSFCDSSSGNNPNYLKKPHPGQVIGIFSMLNMAGDNKVLSNNLVQILSGEGKSIQLAITAAILAKLGYAVNVACYSKYLSSRDYADFSWLFEMIGIKENINYGTFNTLCESILNQSGNLRELTADVITGKNSASIKKRQDRETILLIDEVDVFFNRDFYGALYNPSLTLKSDEITKLITTIWNHHKSGNTLNLNSVKKFNEYEQCKKGLKSVALLDQAIVQMLGDLTCFNSVEHQYEIRDGKILYVDQDGTTSDISIGYKTMWAYHYENSRSNSIAIEELNERTGLNISCGNFAYSEMPKKMMGLFDYIFGVTGTLRELSAPENALIREEYNIRQQTFIPSAYGDNRLNFAKKKHVKIISNEKDGYYTTLVNEISKWRKGSVLSTENIRPLLVFFEDDKSLNQFLKSKSLQDSGINTRVMTQETSSNMKEENRDVFNATLKGQVTLIVKEKGRGRDFYCSAENIEQNGGIHVITTFFPDELSLETQLNYRTARQGQDGSASMVLCEEDLVKKYDLSKFMIQSMRDQDNIYNCLHDKRIEKFTIVYGKLTEEMTEVREVLHQPSLEYWKKLCSPMRNQDEVLSSLLKLNMSNTKTSKQAIHKSRTIILLDATGSMSSVIEATKKCISNVVNNLQTILEANQIAKDNMVLQIAIYTALCGPSALVFDCSDWSNDSRELQFFINSISAQSFGYSGNRGFESMEVGLDHARIESEKVEGVTQVLVFTDAGAPNEQELTFVRSIDKDEHSGKTYFQCKTAFELAKDFKSKNLPIFTFFVDSNAMKDRERSKRDLREIASLSGGQMAEINLSDKDAHVKVSDIIGNQVIDNMTEDSDPRREEMKKQYAMKSHRG